MVMGNKNGVSTVVATVLVVLLTVAAVSILWSALFPLIHKAIIVGDISARFAIERSGSYTVYDPVNYRLRVQVSRASDEAEVVALKFVIDSNGNSQAFRTPTVPKPNTVKVYVLAVGFLENIDSVKLVPIYVVNGEEVEREVYYLEERIPHRDNALLDTVGNDAVEVSEGLVFYYSFDEAPGGPAGQQVFDYSGHGHTGTIGGDVQFTENGKVGGAYQFDGDGDYITLAMATSGDSLESATKTIAFWAKPECKLTSSVFGSHENYVVTFYDVCGVTPFLPNSDSLIAYYLTSDQSSSSLDFGSLPIEESQWHHYVTTWSINGNDVTIRLYIDSVFSEEREEIGQGYGTIDTNFYLGASADSFGNPIDASSYSGIVDEFRVYDRVLSDAEIVQLYQVGQTS